MSEGGEGFQLPEEIMAAMPSDPYEQMDLARNITSFAVASRVSNLEAEANYLRIQLDEKDRIAADLQEKLSSIEKLFQETDARLKLALDQNIKISQERDSLAKKLAREFGKKPTSEEHSSGVESMRDNIETATSLLDPLTDLVQEEKPTESAILDVTDTFTTDMVFNSRDEVIRWSRETGKTVGTVLVIKRSDCGVNGKGPRLTIGCERGGEYRKKQGGRSIKESSRRTGSKRCGCPFLLRAIKMPIEDQWMVKVDSGTHNHPATESFEGHSFARRLTPEEKSILQEMSVRGVKPKDVLKAIKQRNIHNVSNMSTIYNARAKMRLSGKARKSQMQQLVHKLGEHKNSECHRSDLDT